MRVLILDNNDSFTRNLEHLLAIETGAIPEIVPYADIGNVQPDRYDSLCISPGPGRPEDYPGYGPLLDSGVPVLGICMGMQIANVHFGGRVSRLAECVHGRTSLIELGGRQIEVARYHSLGLTEPAGCFEILAATEDGIPMAMVHRGRPIIGFQFHPESFMTPDGRWLIDFAFRKLSLR